MRKLILLVFICLTSTRPAFALDATVGTVVTCTDWLEERDKTKAWIHGHPRGEEMPRRGNIASTWLIGFLEGYSFGCPRTEPSRPA